MAHSQTPADIHLLAALVGRLVGLPAGPIKAWRIRPLPDGGQVDVWMVTVRGAADVKRASARLVRGAVALARSHRRVYLDLRVQSLGGEWKSFGDDDFRAAGLAPPWEYDGPAHLGVALDGATGTADWWDAGTGKVLNCTYSIPYHRLLPGDRERAIAEADADVRRFERGE